MPLSHDPTALKGAILALVAATADNPGAVRLYRRMLKAALEGRDVEPDVTAGSGKALAGLATICTNTATELRRRADVHTVAEAFDQAGEVFEYLAEKAGVTTLPHPAAT